MNAADFLLGIAPDELEAKYEQYKIDPAGVDERWRLVFAGYDLGATNVDSAPANDDTNDIEAKFNEQLGGGSGAMVQGKPNLLVQAHRELGHLIANLDPLGNNQVEHPLLKIEEFGLDGKDLNDRVKTTRFGELRNPTLGTLLTALQETYCSTFAVQYTNIADKTKRDWLEAQMEPTRNKPALSLEDRKKVWHQIMEAETFERFLHAKFRGQKRFSIEGGETLVTLLHTLIDEAAESKAEELVIGMPHRGRLSVLANVLNKPYELMLAEFDGLELSNKAQGAGDVKYHKGYSTDVKAKNGDLIHLSLSNNPSHLEAVYPVVEGMVRAKQSYKGDTERKKILPVVLHGDSSFAGQGVVFETLQLSGLEGFTTGGTVHIIVDNQVGFTTNPSDTRPSRYPSDLARVIDAPVFHVNADDPEAVVQAARLALGFRQEFGSDTFVHLMCYRKHGHNELDDPTFTQPRMYGTIKEHPSVVEQYGNRLINDYGVDPRWIEEETQMFRGHLDERLDYARHSLKSDEVQAYTGRWEGFNPDKERDPRTGVAKDKLLSYIDALADLPASLNAHNRLPKHFAAMRDALTNDESVLWAVGELLGYASLLVEGVDIRLTGQDVGRGTFTHRHAVLTDMDSGEAHIQLNHLVPDQGHIEIHNSNLSEAGVLGYEYGVASADPKKLVIWEAQFGDFSNGAQVIIDQFISSAESKWQRSSGLMMLLPHGYEGQGPEHSSARLERFLQLCAEDNMQVVYPSTPAQMFHLIRRQGKRVIHKPLIVMSPKSLLRMPAASSKLSEFSRGSFQKVVEDPREQELVGDSDDYSKIKRVIFCTGHVYYSLDRDRQDLDRDDIAIHRIEQLYPAPVQQIRKILARYSDDIDTVWVQEEPWNQGAWHFIQNVFRNIDSELEIRYIGRDEAASPATGSHKVHLSEESDFVAQALSKPGLKNTRKRKNNSKAA